MQRINMAYIRTQGIDYMVFDADSKQRTSLARDRLLGELTRRAQLQGPKIDKSALMFVENGRVIDHGTPDLVKYLVSHGLPRWTHTIDV
jgi:hypothetical protein